ncbi:MAG TPA: alpha/beta hydrolase [Thermoanaerobaculia bacterium]|nr:alpha/beta hydrolase [Thermoanaerobaculia bacterium]
MRHRQFRFRRPRRSRGLLWVLLGLAGVGTVAVVLGERRRRGSAPDRPEEAPEAPNRDFYPEPPESVSVWVPGPAGNLYVRDGGKSDHVPIVFVHSVAGNGGQWALQLDHLRRHRRAVALDLRGHGESDPADDGDYSISGMAGDIEAVVDQLGLRRFILGGHSLGSLVAIEYASRHPDRVAGLLLADPNGDLTSLPQEEKESFLGPLRQDPLGELSSYFRQLVVGGDADAARWVLEDLRLTHEDAIVKALEGSMEYPATAALAKYPGPKLAVISDMNNLPYSLHRLVPELTTRLMPGTGHWLMMDRPEAFNHIVDEFLNEVEG